MLFSLSQYETLEAAVATRRRLHGTKWPSTNPKHLDVDFLSAEGAQKLSEGGLVLDEELVQPEGSAGEGAKEEGTVETGGQTERVSPKESIQKSQRTGMYCSACCLCHFLKNFSGL